MFSKLRRYYKYLQRFIESPRKFHTIKELADEIKSKGPLRGIQSFLHIKSGNYVPDVTREEFIGTRQLAQVYHDRVRIVLPCSPTPLVSIIIPMYNQLDYTYDCIRSVFENNKRNDYEIIVADDKSSIDSSVLEKEYFENLVLIRNSENLGFLRNCNNAAKKAKGEYLVFLNNDTQVMPGWLDELLEIFQLYPDAGLTGSKLMYPNGCLQEAGGVIWRDGGAINFGNRDNPEKPEYNYVKEADYISGASIMIKKSLWVELGGFDERYVPAYCEDSDLCFAVRKAGYKVYYQPFSEVVHFEGITHGKDETKGIKQYQVKNKDKFTDKWHSELQLQSKKSNSLFYDRDRTQGKRHILVVDHNVPTLDKDAGSRTINNFVDTLISMGLKVHFMVPNMYPSRQYMKVQQLKGVEVLHGEEYIAWRNNWKHYLINNSKYFDAILLSRSSVCTQILKFLRHINYSGKIIYYGHDLGFLRVEKEALSKNDPSLMKLARKLKADEDFMYENSDTALMINHEEIKYLADYHKKPLEYIIPYFYGEPGLVPGYSEREGIIFVGGFNHPPNHDAVKWFLDEVYAGLAAKNIPFMIVGSNIPEFVGEYKARFPLLQTKSDVSIEELNECYNKARIAVVPLLSGAGVKGKVVEAMSKGVPVAGTDFAFEGLVRDDYFLYKGMNTPNSLSDNILNLYRSGAEWEKYSNFNLRYVSEHFSIQKMRETFERILGK